MRCLLYSSNLGSEFWSDTLLYLAYIYNRTNHEEAINKTPYKTWTGRQPSMKDLKTFGTSVIIQETGTRPTKLDRHVFK